MIVRARLIVTMEGRPVENGAVAISGSRIAEVGSFSEVAKKCSGEEIVDLGEQILLPGLINAHCHLDYTCLRAKIPRQGSFTDWIRAINAEKAKLSPEDYLVSINDGFAEAKRFGTTTIANLTAFPELVWQIQAPIRTWWFAELIDVRDPSRANEIVDLAVDQLKPRKHWGLAPHALFTASANLYRRCEEVARRENILLATHLGESREEMSMFREAEGPLYDFLKEIGRDMNDCDGATPLGHFSEIIKDVSTSLDMTRDWMLVHLNEIVDPDFDSLARTKANFSVVHCPRSHQYFGHPKFQFRRLRELGFNICLGTDSLASNHDLSLFAEMRAFQKGFPNTAPEEILKMVTLAPAMALHQENALGKIRTNFLADLIAIPITQSTSIFEEIIAFDGPPGLCMLGGRVLANR
jgi:cytosine/adenosine deaminase-related metal-dependent hydrolase